MKRHARIIFKKVMEFLFYCIVTAIPITILGLFNTLFSMYLYEH